MTDLPVKAIGIAWYGREDYARILEVMEDREVLPRTFEKWLYAAEKGRQKFLGTGVIVVKANIKPDEFVAWCAANNRRVDSDGRKAFANLVAYQYAMEVEKPR
jgi:hypothetical protein